MIAGDLSSRRRATLSRWKRLGVLALGVLWALTVAALFALQWSPDSPALVAGQVSSKTVLAPEHITFASQIETDDARARAELAIAQVYDPPNPELARERLRVATRVFDHIDSVRHDPFSSPEQKLEWVVSIPGLALPSTTINRTLLLDENNYHRVVSETLYVLEVTMRDVIRPVDLNAEYTKISSRISLALSADQADLVTQWTKVFVVANSFFNELKTNELRTQARERVGTVYRTLEKGEAVVREGEIVTPQAIEALEALGILQTSPAPGDYAGPALLALLLVIFLVVYLARLRPALFGHWRVLLLIAFVILLFTLGVKLLAAERGWLLYLYPIAAAAMLLAVLVDGVVAVGAVVFLALAMGFLAHASLEMTIYALIGGVIAALALERVERLPAFLWAGVYVAAANAGVVAIFRILAHDTDIQMWELGLAAAVGNGALAGLLAIGSLFVLGKLFGITTALELIDLARPTHPLLQKLLRDAPGTYHHSLVVSQLAEHAAQSIGADPLLIRVVAYYHDVGKTLAPQMFIENQLLGVNIHDTLEPQQSAAIVIQHVSHGVELARQHHLPTRLRDFIREHHGTTLVAYFHRKALKTNGHDQPVDEKHYRYPGPKPQSRESGILMLADGIEATMRAEHPGTPEGIRSIVDRIVADRLRDGQLEQCDLTLREIQQVKEAFLQVLQGLYHPRVRYPEPPPATEPEIVETGELQPER